MKFLRDEKGQGLSEYALIIALVAVVAIAGLVLLGPIILDKFNEVSCGMQGEGWNPKNIDAIDGGEINAQGWYYVNTKGAGFNPNDFDFGSSGLRWASNAPKATDPAGCYKVIA